MFEHGSHAIKRSQVLAQQKVDRGNGIDTATVRPSTRDPVVTDVETVKDIRQDDEMTIQY